ncbi:aspartate kinase [Synchytrium microbalum]|uniref:Aspartokinase n=1 Tax=Synchytrium microbalum TaxID=1806994 RepID=A0A507CJ45_9FUNG|nr:aspartate kinase [Synchytrium microbalum]TPX37733.1 aspartate kinase [Synchytrium microbalum]
MHATAETENLPCVVQKYGGTSIGTAERLLNVAKIVKSSLNTNRVIVVLSAMSSQKKVEGTTSRLLEAAHEALTPNSNRYLDIIDKIEQDHVKAVRLAVDSADIRAGVEVDVKHECKTLKQFLGAAEIIDEISPRSRDIIVSVGEKLSARIFTAVLQSQGVDAGYVNLEKVVDRQFDEKSLDHTFYQYLTQRLASSIRECPNQVPVVTGYFGPVPGSLLNTIGRGYTDLTAALIAVAVDGTELQIWKEVDGIFTADPRKAPKAKLLAKISPEEASELTYYGSEVIHPFTMEQVIRARIPIRILNTFRPEGAGTVILPPGMFMDGKMIKSYSSNGTSNGSNGASANKKPRSEKYPTAVTIKDNVTVINVHSNRKSVSHGFFASIFTTLDKFGIVVDLIATSEVHVSMALGHNVHDTKLELAIAELQAHGIVDVIKDLAILSLIGQLKHMIGIASRMFTVLAKHGVNIEMISQGASEINISCVIQAKDAQFAISAVHDEIILADQE